MRRLLPFALVACAGADGISLPPPPEATVGWSEVAPMVSTRCGRCHTADGVTGLPLTTWAEVRDARALVGAAVEQGVMPPWLARGGDYPFVGDPTLLPEELDLLRTWIAEDGPLGDADPALPVVAPPPPALPRVDLVLSPSRPYLPTGSPDDHRCFVLRGEEREAGWIRGLRIAVGNASAVHHARLSTVTTPDHGAQLLAREHEDDEAGFRCDDGMATADLGGVAERVATWLPGDGPLVFPEGAGMALAAEPYLVLMVHYDVNGSDGRPDLTRVELMLEDEVERPVRMLKLMDPAWFESMVVPAGEGDVAWTFRTRLLGDVVDAPDGVAILSTQLHMHGLGTSGLVSVYEDGRRSTLLDVPAWDVDWQLDYWLETPLVLQPGDELELTCRFDNSLGVEEVRWGESSADEMCGAELYITPPT